MKIRLLRIFGSALLTLLIGIAAVSSIAASEFNQAAKLYPTTTPYAEPADSLQYWVLLNDGLQGIPQVVLLEYADTRQNGGKRLVTVTHRTSASTAQQRVNEWMVILAPLGETLRVHRIDVDQFDLTGVTSSGTPIGIFTTTAQDLLAFTTKELSRADFLYRAKYVWLTQPTPTQTVSPVPTRPISVIRPTVTPLRLIQPTVASEAGSCPFTSRPYCSQMTSCEMAYACLYAGWSKLDGDSDGVPCESICPGG